MKRSIILFVLSFADLFTHAADSVPIGGRRELFVDHFLVDQLNGVRLQLHAPRDEGVAFAFDKPWEGLFSGYATIVTLETADWEGVRTVLRIAWRNTAPKRLVKHLDESL